MKKVITAFACLLVINVIFPHLFNGYVSSAGCEVLLSGTFTGGSELTQTFVLQKGQVVVLTAIHSDPAAILEADIESKSTGNTIAYGTKAGTLSIQAVADSNGDYDAYIKDDNTTGNVIWSISAGDCNDSDGDGSNVIFYNQGYQILGFAQPNDEFHIYADCQDNECDLIAKIDITALSDEPVTFRSDLVKGWKVVIYPLGEDFLGSGAKVYQVNTYLNDVLQDDHLELLIYPDGDWTWRKVTWRG